MKMVKNIINFIFMFVIAYLVTNADFDSARYNNRSNLMNK